MDLYILDKEYVNVSYVDGYESLIWTDRYQSAGDFEIYTPITSSWLDYAKPDYYLWNSDTDRIMIIENIAIGTETENGNFVTITGRSLEAILERRVVWNKKSFTDTDPLEIIFSLLDSEIEHPTDEKRRIPNFSHEPLPEGLPVRDKITVELFGETLLEVVETLLASTGIGFKVVMTQAGEMIFSFFAGVDRSFNQEVNPWVVFSDEYENLVNTDYSENHSEYRNAALIKGEEDSETGVITKAEYILEDAVGLARKEVLVDGGVSTHDENNNPIPASRYQELLLQKGKEYLDSVKLVKSFEGGIESHTSFIFNKDFYLGDIVQIVTPTNVETSARITEVIRSFNNSGIDTIPSFSIIE